MMVLFIESFLTKAAESASRMTVNLQYITRHFRIVTNLYYYNINEYNNVTLFTGDFCKITYSYVYEYRGLLFKFLD